MELKILCDCGQKYAFDVEPIADQMPFFVNCPSCGKDGTQSANSLLAKPNLATGVRTKAPIAVRLSVPSAVAESPVLIAPAPFAAGVPLQPAAPRQWEKSDMTERHSLALGILGAIVGACLGVALMFTLYKFVGFVFPVVGISIGALAGFGARLLYKGTDMTLGVFAGIIALIATGGVFLLLFGIFAIMNVISLMISVSVAYKLAS